MNAEEFRTILDLRMVSDPWPLTSEQEDIMTGFLSREAEERGFDGWVDAYHEFEPKEA